MKIIFEKPVLVSPLSVSLESFLSNEKTVKAAPMTSDEIRNALGKTQKDLPDGVIHQVALDLGLEVKTE